MRFQLSKIGIEKITLIVCFLGLVYISNAQQTDSSTKVVNFKATGSITNNGFSFIPAFSLGKPAAIFNLNINGGKRFSFEPEFRFALQDGRPWSFIFIWRYKIIDQKRFQLTAGTHFPAVPFRILAYETDPLVKHTLAVSRVIPIELTPNVIVGKRLVMSLFCLYAKGISDDAVNHTSLISLRAVSMIPLGKKLSLRINPQLFHLKLDSKSGFYTASNFTLSSSKSPFFIGSMVNVPLKTDIVGKPLDWNVSIGYTLDKKLVVKK